MAAPLLPSRISRIRGAFTRVPAREAEGSRPAGRWMRHLQGIQGEGTRVSAAPGTLPAARARMRSLAVGAAGQVEKVPKAPTHYGKEWRARFLNFGRAFVSA